MFQRQSKKTAMLAGGAIIIVAVLGVLVIASRVRGETYIRIVDAQSTPTDATPSPGADLKAVEVHKTKNDRRYFASAVVSSDIKSGGEENENNFTDPQVLLAKAEENGAMDFVSLGGGEVVVRINALLQSGDELIIHEVGAANSASADYFDVYTSTSDNGPWILRGTGTGLTTLTIE
ncbi:MAG: hypothetical protein ABIG66_00955 [Candidatus Kerfeldbacteria bacterium]